MLNFDLKMKKKNEIQKLKFEIRLKPMSEFEFHFLFF